MKSIKTTFTILLLLFYLTSNAQTYTWNGGDGDFIVATNWTPAGVPLGGSNIIFNTGGNIYISGLNETITSLGDITITNGTNVTLETSAIAGYLNVMCNVLTVDESSSLIIDQSDKYIQLSFSSANIDGSILLDNNEHKIIPISSTEVFNFNNGANFIAGGGLVGSPFGDSGLDNVKFNDGANYYHFGGNSPFGNTTGSNVANFSPESNYYIENDGSLILFSNKTYGNIYIGEIGKPYVNVTVNGAGTGADTFLFNSMITENGSLLFAGTNTDKIEINEGIDAKTGNIKFQCSSFIFSGDTYLMSDIANSFDVSFELIPSASNDNILTVASSLTIDAKLNIESSSIKNLNVAGLIDCGESVISLNNINIDLLNSSKLITEHPNGIEGSIDGDFTIENLTTFEFAGNNIQNVGLINHNSSTIGKIIIDKTSENVIMNSDILLDSLKLFSGDLQIEDNTLTITGDIEYGLGKLNGIASASILQVEGSGTGGGIMLNSDLQLNTFIVNRNNGYVHINGSGLFFTNNTYINNGTLDINIAEFQAENLLELNGGELQISDGALNINGTFLQGGGFLYGGTGAKLRFLSNAAPLDNLPALELAEFYSETSSRIKMGGDLLVYDILNLASGELLISEGTNYYTLTLNGDFQSGGGVLEGTNSSSLIIGDGTNANDITLAFSSSFNKLNSLAIDRVSKSIGFNEDIYVDDNIDLSAGMLVFSNSTLFLSDVSSIVNNSETSYIITGNNGFVNRDIVAGTSFVFPVGTDLFYTPAKVNPENNENFNIKVSNNVFQYGNAGTLVTDERVVNLTWNVEHPNNTINYDMLLSWDFNAEGINFNQIASYLANYDDAESKWVKAFYASSDVSVSQEFYATEISSQGLFSVSSIHNIAPIANNQEFTINEHSANGTIVGQLVASDPGVANGQTLIFSNNVTNPNSEAFSIEENGEVIVQNSDLLEFSITPTFTYNIDVCDDGNPVKCTQFGLTINLAEITDEFMVTNFISPNGDGKNDTWIIRGLEKGTYNVAVIDGKGNVVFRSNDYNNDWNGTKTGNRLPPGVYYYTITSQNNSKKGTITLVR